MEPAEEALPLDPPPPDQPPPPATLVLGRFQPLHRGHVALIEAAIRRHVSQAAPGGLCIAIGSSNRETSLENPWTASERLRMLQLWWEAEGASMAVSLGAPRLEPTIVTIPDLDDPPRWVHHAEQYHGPAGCLVTSDAAAAALYRAAGWPIEDVAMTERERFEGWRVRETARMVSTIPERDAARALLASSVPDAVLDLLIDEDWIWILSQVGPQVDRA